MSTDQTPTSDGLEVRSIGDEMIVFDLETNETHLLTAQGVDAFERAGLNRRTLLKTGATASAVLAAGAVQTIMAPSAAANSSTPPKTISGSGTCNNGGNVNVAVVGNGFLLGAVNVTITYPSTNNQGVQSTVTTAAVAFNQPKTGALSGGSAIPLNPKVTPGTTTATITATDRSGVATLGTVTLSNC